VEEVARRTLPGVVEIYTYDATGDVLGQGTGFFVSPRTIVTNEHVVDGAYSADVFSDDATYDRVAVLNEDAQRDLAILAVDAAHEAPLPINHDACLEPGQRVVVIGYPLALERSVSDGVISGVRTEDGIQEIQITAPTSPGSSGSPVLDQEGRVIGVVYAGYDEGENLNFAIGGETLNEFLALEENPRQLEVAGSYVLWRVVVKWILKAVVFIMRLAVGGCLLMVATVGFVLLWSVLRWLWRWVHRLVLRTFGGRRHRVGLSAPAPQAFPRRERRYVTVRRSLTVAAVLLVAAIPFFSASVSSAPTSSDPAESPVVQVEPASTIDTQTVTVYITRTGTKYHCAGCRYLRKSKIPISLKDAKQHYTPCSVCKPPS
jgi:hypothetical protein